MKNVSWSFIIATVLKLYFLPFGVFAENGLDSYDYQTSISMLNNNSIRGLKIDNDMGAAFYFGGSSKGYSLNLDYGNTNDDNYYLLSISDSYGFEEAFVYYGVSYFNLYSHSSAEAFFELKSRKDYFNYYPSLLFVHSFEGSKQYVEASLSYPFDIKNWYIVNEIVLSAGDFYSDSFGGNHASFGFKASKKFLDSNSLDLVIASHYISYFGDEVKEAPIESSFFQSSISFTYRF